MPSKPLTGAELLQHNFTWVDKLGKYRDLKTGRFVSEKLITRELDKVVSASAEAMKGLTRRMVDGSLSLPEWQLAMEKEIKLVTRQAAVIARGGLNQMSPADWGRVGAETKRQYQFLRKFANEVASGKQPLNGRAVVRAGLYGESGRGAYQETKRSAAKRKGFTEERRVLGFAEHCESSGGLDGCVELAAKGWQPIGKLPRIGESPCRTHCHCNFEYR